MRNGDIPAPGGLSDLSHGADRGDRDRGCKSEFCLTELGRGTALSLTNFTVVGVSGITWKNAAMSKKRQHTVPRFYLDGFVEHGGGIWQYPRDQSKPIQISSRSSAVGKHFYTYRMGDGSRTTALEDALSNVESKAAPVIRRLLEGHSIEESDRLNLSRLIAVQMVRGFDVRDRAVAQSEKLRDPDFATAFLDSCSEIPAETRDRYKQEILESGEGPSIDQSFYLPYVMANTERYGHLISEMRWRFERVPRGCFFVTSDTPVVVRRRGHDLDEYPVGLARADLDVEMTFPLSKDMMLLAAWSHTFRSRRRSRSTTFARVQELNRRTVLTAHRYVFSPRRCDTVEQLIASHADFKLKHHLSIFVQHDPK